MDLFGRFKRAKGRQDADRSSSLDAGEDVAINELRAMDGEPDTLATAMRARRGEREAGSARPASAMAENDGLPSVNRRKGGNKLVTLLGFVFILGVAMALIVAVNGDRKAKPKKRGGIDEQVTNNLPPIAIPAAPPPIQIAAVPGAAVQPPAGKPPSTAVRPIPVQGAARNGKPPMEWTDRKMSGTLLVEARQAPGNAPANGPAHVVQVSDPDQTAKGQAAVFAAQGGGQPFGANNELAAKLEPTVTRAASASLLPDRDFLVTKGTTLDCALETALDSSVPGITTCGLTRDVYSDNGRVLLLDRGSTLVGEYQSGLKQGQVRLFVLWTRAKTPNGVVVSLNSPGTDALGRSGLEGWVDNHFAERFGAAILMSLLKDTVTAIANRSNGGSGSTTNFYGGAATGGEKIVEKILESTVNIPPTIIKNQGDHIQVMVARDLDFSSVYGLRLKP